MKIRAIAIVILFSSLLSLRSEMSGDVGRSRRFVGKLNPGASLTNQCEFSIELERIMFRLNSFKEYKVVRIRLENTMSTPIRLSREEDSIELDTKNGTVVRGTFNLSAQDGRLWDALGDDLRKELTYPLSIRGVKGNDASERRPEVVYVFAFFPAANVNDLPRSFRYTIRSIGKTIRIELPGATAA